MPISIRSGIAVVQSTAPFAWRPIKVGGGGFTRDIDIAPDGTKVCKVDVYGAYVWNPSVASTGNAGGFGLWQSLTAPGRIPAGDPAYSPAVQTSYFDGMGAWDIRIAPSNSSIFYMLWLGMMYKTTNKGVTFTNQTNNAGGTFPLQTESNGNPNSPANNAGPQMAIDPINSNVCWVGNLAGMFFTTNGGTNWSTLSTSILPLPTGGQYSYAVAFDPASAQTGGKTQGIYVAVYGVGIYYSSNGGTSFTQLTGGSFSGTMPTTFIRLVVDKFGVVWLTANASAPNLWNFTVQAGTAFTANTWTNSAAPAANGGTISGVAPDPTSTTSATQRVLVVDFAGCLAQTTNGGSSWGDAQAEQFNQVATDIPWLQTNEAFMTNAGGLKADPSQSNAFYLAEGIGVWTVTPPVTGASGVWSAFNWVSQTAGIESLETTYIISPPGGTVGLAQWDRNWFQPQVGSTGQFPSTYGTWPGSRLNNDLNQSVIFAGNSADWVGASPSTVVLYSGGNGSTAGHQTGSGISTNGGVPVTGWSFFTNGPPGLVTGAGAAAIAASSSTSIMAVANGLFATTNGGATAWANVTPAGSSGWTNGFAQISQQIAADKVTANYYVAFDGTKIYHSANTGGLWTTVTPTFSFGSGAGGPQLKSIPNNAGHYFLSVGGSFGATVDTNNVFYRSTDGGATWSDVSGAQTVREVYVWGFGKPNGGAYPAIFIYGYVNSVLGVWQSVDNCVSWQKIGDAQFGGLTFDNPLCMAGDMNTAGVAYVGFLGSGYLQYSS